MIKQMFIKLVKIVDLNFKNYIFKQTLCFVYLLIYTASSIIFPSFISNIVDDGILVNDSLKIIRYSTMMLLCGIIMTSFYYIQKVSFFKLGNEITFKTRVKLYEKITKLNINYWNKNKVGNVITTLDDDVSKIEELLTTNISDLIINILLSFGIGIYIIMLNPKIGIILILSLIAFAFVQKKIAKKSKDKMKRLRETLGKVNAYTTETINNIPSIQMTGKNNYVRELFRDKSLRLISDSLDYLKTMCLVIVTGQSFNILAIIVTIIIGAFDVQQERMTVGLLFSLTIYVQRLYSPVINLGNNFVKIKSLVPIMDNIFQLMYSENEIKSGIISKQNSLKGKITFECMSFGYDNNYIFKDFNECFLPGEIIGIVGKNGSGKTTIGRLLTKICTPTKGNIKIDDVNIDDYELDYLQNQIGYMTQDNFILSDELNDLFSDNSSKDKMFRYFRELNFTDSSLTTVKENFTLGENKVNISGGEAQKIALYKLYIENKPICILDEPTSALDSLSEDKMIDFICKNLLNKTLIIITHKQKILDICTRIIDFTGGYSDETEFMGN